LFSQTAYINYGRGAGKQAEGFSKVEDSLRKQFEEKKMQWPPQELYLRSFKYDRQLEVWVKEEGNLSFRLFKTYKVCMQSGTMGPKRMQGDYQVPEGFYYINEFNPNSNYHLALGLNYPNASDRILSDSIRPGNSIYIHGSCVSTGCIPIADFPIEELYIMASQVKEMGRISSRCMCSR
jgi:murein L,D-transpeptidase YafK